MKKGLIALFSSLGVVGILLLLSVIGSIIGVVVWYYKKKEGYAASDYELQAGSKICRDKFYASQQCIDCTQTTGATEYQARKWCGLGDESMDW